MARREPSPPVLGALHDQKQVISPLPLAAGIREVNLPPVSGDGQVIDERQLLALDGHLGGQQELHFAYVQGGEGKAWSPRTLSKQ